MERFYVCYFEFKDKILSVESQLGIEQFKDGFWIDDNLKMNIKTDVKYWIPPNRILYVEKELR